MSMNAINKMISRYGYRFLPTIEQESITTPAMKEKSKTVNERYLMREVSELRCQLEEVRLKIEGYEFMGDISEDKYGIDLLRKSAAKQYPGSGSHTQE